MNSLFYPPLKRRDINFYYKSEGVFYATYNCQTNYKNVAKDCKFRCVYCDAHIDECGGEPFSLDHFRPRDIFGEKFDGILNIHPFNLHLSCQKCNVLKTNDWKGCSKTIDGETFLSKKGYIDRFEVDISDYLEVNDGGYVQCKNPNGPAEYMIGKLLLNRTNRVYIRKLREVSYKSEKIKKMIASQQNQVLKEWKLGNLTIEQSMQKIELLNNLLQRYSNLKTVSILTPTDSLAKPKV